MIVKQCLFEQVDFMVRCKYHKKIEKLSLATFKSWAYLYLI